MFNQDIVNPFQKELKKSDSILVLLPPEPDELLVSSGLGLFLSLKKMGKKAQIGCSNLNKTSLSQPLDLTPIKSSIGNQNLVINFKFQEENLDKVDYDIDPQGNFQLMIKPKTGSPPPDTQNITYTYSGATADLVVVLGINSLEELGKLYSDEKQFLDQATIVSFNKSSRPANFATHSFHTNSASSIAEMVAFVMLNTNITPTKEASNYLLKDIYSTTNNLNTPRITAHTFEIIAYLMRNGARPPINPVSSAPAAPIFDRPTSLRKIPPAPIPTEWTKPKIFRSTPNKPQ
jgi:hypothetical protein